MRVANWAPGGRAPTSDIAIRPSGRWNHSMWLRPFSSPSARSAGAAASRIPRIGVVDIARRNDAPLDPGMPQHLDGRRVVGVDRVPDDLSSQHHAVEGVLFAGHELLDQDGISFDGSIAEATRQPVVVVDRYVARAPAPAGGFTIKG